MKYGYQLFSAYERCNTSEGLLSTIRLISDYGYDGVEFFDYAGTTPEDLKAVLQENRIAAINSHVSLDRLKNDLDYEIDYAVRAGIPSLTIPWIAPELRHEEFFQTLCQAIPEYADKCQTKGILLCYHNHEFEFERYDQTYLLDALLGSSKDLQLELDTFWTYYAKLDPVSCMKQYRDRLKYIHIKDFLDLSTLFPQFCAIGTGKMDNREILSQAESLGVEWVVVEQDNSKIDVMESAKLSIEYLKHLQ